MGLLPQVIRKLENNANDYLQLAHELAVQQQGKGRAPVRQIGVALAAEGRPVKSHALSEFSPVQRPTISECAHDESRSTSKPDTPACASGYYKPCSKSTSKPATSACASGY